MKPVLRFQGIYRICIAMLVVLSATSYSATNPTRVDFFDKSGNPLMFMYFRYEGDRLTGRTLYMADSTFKREVNLVTDPANGARKRETSFDFNGDTSFVTSYNHDGNITKFSIRDQFNLDHVGGEVSYDATSANNDFSLKYADGTFASRIVYTNQADGTPIRVDVFNESGVMQYYGTFSTVGVTKRSSRIGGAPQAVIKHRGSAVDILLNMTEPGIVKCELLTLSGRVAGVLLNENVPKGHFLRSVSARHNARVANGVYLLVVSVNGKVVSSSRYLSEIAITGGVK